LNALLQALGVQLPEFQLLQREVFQNHSEAILSRWIYHSQKPEKPSDLIFAGSEAKRTASETNPEKSFHRAIQPSKVQRYKSATYPVSSPSKRVRMETPGHMDLSLRTSP